MNDLSKEMLATEAHEKAVSYYRASEKFGYKFLMELKKIRDGRLFIELGSNTFAEYTEAHFGYNSDTMNLRIQDASVWEENYTEALRSFGKHKAHQLAQFPKKQRNEVLKKGIPTSEGNKTVEKATTREIVDYQRKIKEKDELINKKDQQITMQAEMIDSLNEREPETVEKEVVVEKIPDDYEQLKKQSEKFTKEIESLKERNSFIEQEYTSLLEERKDVNEKSDKYEELTKAINQAKGKLTSTQKLISNYKKMSDVIKKSNEFLLTASGLMYSDLSEVIDNDGLAKRELNSLINNLERFLHDLKNATQNEILEGEIING